MPSDQTDQVPAELQGGAPVNNSSDYSKQQSTDTCNEWLYAYGGDASIQSPLTCPGQVLDTDKAGYDLIPSLLLKLSRKCNHWVSSHSVLQGSCYLYTRCW